MPPSPTMRAIEISQPGGPEVLMPTTRPVPTPQPGEVLIKVAAAGINRPDVLQRKGLYPPMPGVSDLPGLEVSGWIEAAGSGVSMKTGTPVMALLGGGGYAEYACAQASHTIPLFSDLDMNSAAALPETVFTVWANVFEAGKLTCDATLFVHGATSGIGTTAIAMAKAAGATVYGTAGTDEKCKLAEELGYARCFNYQTDDWSKSVQDLGGADVVLDMVGGDYVVKNLALLKHGGRHVSIGVQGGISAQIAIFDIMRRQLILTGSVLRVRSTEEKARLARQVEQHVMPWLKSGQVRPLIAKTFPLEEAASAHAYMESGELMGKVILTL